MTAEQQQLKLQYLAVKNSSQWIIGIWRDRVARVRTLSTYDPNILAQFRAVAVQLLDW